MSVGAVLHQVHYGNNGPGPLSIKLCNYVNNERNIPHSNIGSLPFVGYSLVLEIGF